MMRIPLLGRAGTARVVGLTAGVVMTGAAIVVAVWLPHASGGSAKPASGAVAVAWQRPAVSSAGLAQRSGVRIVRLAVSGDGGLLDLRYKVLDADKAAAIHDTHTPPAVVDERTGLVISELLMNHSHTGPFKPAVTYYLVFSNPGGWVHRGSTVTVLLGNAQVDNVPVE
jgi:hypothetical protein